MIDLYSAGRSHLLYILYISYIFLKFYLKKMGEQIQFQVDLIWLFEKLFAYFTHPVWAENIQIQYVRFVQFLNVKFGSSLMEATNVDQFQSLQLFPYIHVCSLQI